jgi:sulfite dehydrogenase (cytochrome) subunit B
MKVKLALAAIAASGLVLVAARSTLAAAVTYTLPSETATLKKAAAPGYEKAEQICSACHSVDYISTQPPGKGKDFWTAEVNKMVSAYGAPIEEADRPAIIDYLAANY